MRPGLFGLILASATCGFAASPAHAIMCYVIYDRGDNVIYQSTYPPLDMSNAGYPQREALRARGQHLTFGDVPKCPTVVYLTGSGGTTDLRVDEFVAGMAAPYIPETSANAKTIQTPAGAQVRAARPRQGS
jgi:hypothetical protein